jgi:hypothetical protein
MKIENIIRRVLKEQQEEQILKIPSLKFFNNDWSILQKFLESQGYPRYSIGGDLNLRDSDIESLGNLVRVEGDLDLYGCISLQSIENLEYVGGFLDLFGNKNLQSLGNLEYVGGWVDLNDTKIETLGNLKYVGGWLDLRRTDIKTLGNLNYVGGGLNLTFSYVKTLGNLEYVGGMLDLFSNKDLQSLGNLEYVGGYLDLHDTPLSEKYTEDDIRKMVKVVGVIVISYED